MDTPSSSPRSVVVSDLERSTTTPTTPSQGGPTVLFPWKLHDMLRTCITEDKESIVAWLSHGNSFKVHNVPVFVSEILPLFFKQTKYKSFQRQLNLWGFERIQNGPEKGAYYARQFLRDKPILCRHLTRQRAKKVPFVTAANATTKTIPFPKKSSKMRQVSPIPSRFHHPIPRNVSEGSLQGFEELLGKFDANSRDPLDLAEFEGFSFHLLDQDRYEELNLELKFTSASENQVRQDQNTALLKELEQGFFGMPKTAFDTTFEWKHLDAQAC